MSDLTVGNRRLPVAVTKLPQGLDAATAQQIAKNGADDVVVRIGQDTFLASGRGVNMKGLKPGAVVAIGGKSGNVIQVDKQLNTFGEGMVAMPGLIVGGVGAAWGIGGFIQGMLAGANMAGIGIFIAGAAVIAGLAINLVPALYGHFRKVDA